MVFRLMLASAVTLALGAAALLAAPEPPAERLASRAEFLAAHPQPRVLPVACAPAPAARATEANI